MARALLDEIGPHFPQLRFYPVSDDRPLSAGALAHRQDAGTTVAQLEAVKPNMRVERQKEAVRVWQPLYDRLVALFAETVEGPLPTLHREANGEYRVEGGWPCQRYPDGWADRAHVVVDDYRRLRAEHQLCKGPDSPKDGFAVLRGCLARRVGDPQD